MELLVHVFEQSVDGQIIWTALGLPEPYLTVSGPTRLKVQRMLEERIRAVCVSANADPTKWARAPMPLSFDLVKLRLELTLRTGRGVESLEGVFPIVLEPRWTGRTRAIFAYHPRCNEAWVVLDDETSMEVLLRRRLSTAFAAFGREYVEGLKTNGKERLHTTSVDLPRTSLVQSLREKPTSHVPRRRIVQGKVPLSLLPTVGVDLSRRAMEGSLALGAPRPDLDAQLAALLAADRPRSIAVVGQEGTGRTTLLHRAVRRMLEDDGFFLHSSFERVRRVFSVSARRVLAGMSHFGEWEERLLRVVEEARAHRIVLYFEDAALLGAIGRSRESDRAFAQVLEGPVRRGEVTLFAELTEEGLARLSDEAPRLAESLSVLAIPRADRHEAIRLALDRQRRAEREHGIELALACAAAVVDQSSALFPGIEHPGKGMRVLERLIRSARDKKTDEPIGPMAVTRVIAERTGIPRIVLDPSVALDPVDVEARFTRSLVGQPDATRAVVDLVMRIKAGLVDASRPFAVYLFTGPTGTGKTETAKWIARELYGGDARLVRIDMGELTGPDAVARLAGDRYVPEGLLTSRVRAQPFSVVLLDEIEKAHPSALHLLLAVLDEGRLTDALGVTTDFTNTVIVMTSNLGARTSPRVGYGTESAEEVLLTVSRAVRDFFPPELFNRIDRVVPFRPLDHGMARRIVELELARLFARKGLSERRIAVRATEGVVALATNDAFDPDLGARSVKRWMERELGGHLSTLVSGGGHADQRAVYLYVPQGAPGRVASHVEIDRARPPLAGRRLLEVVETRTIDELAQLARREVGQLLDDEDMRERLLDGRRALLSSRPSDAYAFDLALEAIEVLRDDTRSLFADSVNDARELLEADEDRRGHEVKILPTSNRDRSRARRLSIRGGRDAASPGAWTVPGLRGFIARAMFLGRALERIEETELHAVTLEIARLGERAANAGGIVALAEALSRQLGTATAIGVEIGGRGRVVPTFAEAKGADRVLVRIEGLGAALYFAEEEGTHVLVSAERPPELASVRVRASGRDDDRVEDALARRGALRRAFERALDEGRAPLPENPDAVLPRVRRIVTLVSLRTGPSFSIDDEVLSEHATVRVPSLGAALVPFFESRASIVREGSS